LHTTVRSPGAGMNTYDALVVGGGPAGISAALWLARYRAQVLLIDNAEPRNRWADAAHGYLGSDPIHPAKLLEAGRSDLTRYPEVGSLTARVEVITRNAEAFHVETDTAAHSARAVVLATGVGDVFPKVARFLEHYGADVFHCPSCDGYEAKDRDVIAFGWNAEIAHFAQVLLGWARSVTILTGGHRFEGDHTQRGELAAAHVPILTESARALLGERGALRGVRLGDGRILECNLVFFAIEHIPRTALATALGCELTAAGCVKVDTKGATNITGVFAAGDVTPGLQLVQVAAASGTVAGVGAAQYLRTIGHLRGQPS
jgi:thioredoxin reductase